MTRAYTLRVARKGAPDPYAQHKAAIRKEFGRVTPFRMGRSFGLIGDGLPSPPYEGHALQNFGYALGLYQTVRLHECPDGRPQWVAYREDYFDHALDAAQTTQP